MEFGFSINRDEPAGVAASDAVAMLLERADVASEAGFDLLGFGHRYSIGPSTVVPDRLPLTSWRFQPLQAIAHVAGRLGGSMGYTTNVLLSASAHPVSLAEEVATVDALCGGRFHLGIAVGWLEYEFEAFGVAKEQRVRRFKELVSLYRRLLTETDVTFAGEFFEVSRVTMLARCVRSPMAPLWIGGSVDAAIKRAARLGDAWVASSHIALADLRRQRSLFLAERERLGLPEVVEFPLVRTVYVAETREAALAMAEPALKQRYKERGDRGWFLTQGKDAEVANDAWSAGRWIIGSPDDCVEQIQRFQAELGVTKMILSYPVAGQGRGPEHDGFLSRLQLLGERVLPYCRGL